MTRGRAVGVRTVRVGCPEDDGLPPWWPVRELLRSLGADVDAVFARPSDLEADAARFAISDRVQAELGRTQPLLIVVDDIQWADAASLRFLTNLTTTASMDASAVILTVRDGQFPPDVQRLLAEVGRRTGARQLALPALTADQVAQLVQQVSGEGLGPEEARLLTERTGGNPFFVSEYARLPAADRAAGQVPVGVRSVLSRRLASTDPAVLSLLQHAAIIGDRIDVDLLCAVTDEPVDRLADALDQAVETGMIVVSPSTGAYLFAHGLLREQVLLGISPVRRQRLHARVAGALPEAPDQRAGHLLAALPFLDPTPVYEACRAAALDAETRWDSDSASHWWGAALQVFARLPIHPGSDDERDHLVEAQVEALARAGRDQRVLDVVDEALLVAGREARVRSLGRLAGALLRTAGGWPWVGYTSDPGPLITRLASVEPLVRSDPSAQARVLAAMAVGSCYDPDESRREDLSARAIACAEESGDEDALADALLARAVVFCGVITRVEEVRDLLRRLGQVPHAQARIDEVLAHTMLSWAEMTLGNVDAAEEHRRLGVGGCDLLRLPVARTQLRWAEGAMAQWHGDFAGAAAIFEHAYELHRETELYSSGVYDIAMIGLRWDRDGFRDPVPLREADRTSGPWARVAACVAAGQVAEADRLIGLELAARQPAVWTTYGKFTMLAHLVADIGAGHHARDLIGRLSPIAHCIATIGHVGVVGPVALAVARLHHLLGETDAALAQVAVATELAQRTDGRPALRRCRALTRKLSSFAEVPPSSIPAMITPWHSSGSS